MKIQSNNSFMCARTSCVAFVTLEKHIYGHTQTNTRTHTPARARPCIVKLEKSSNRNFLHLIKVNVKNLNFVTTAACALPQLLQLLATPRRRSAIYFTAFHITFFVFLLFLLTSAQVNLFAIHSYNLSYPCLISPPFAVPAALVCSHIHRSFDFLKNFPALFIDWLVDWLAGWLGAYWWLPVIFTFTLWECVIFHVMHRWKIPLFRFW